MKLSWYRVSFMCTQAAGCHYKKETKISQKIKYSGRQAIYALYKLYYFGSMGFMSP